MKMAKINAEFDTKTKELKVSMNGEAVADVSSIVFYTDWDNKEKGYVELTGVTMNEEESMTKVTRIMANEEEFKVMRDDSVNAELATLFRGRLDRKRN